MAQPAMTNSVWDWEEAPKHFPKPNLFQRKWSWSLYDGLLPLWSTTAFWITVKALHPRSMLSKLMRCSKNCNSCSQHWATEWAKYISTTMPKKHVAQPTLQKLNALGYDVLPHPPYSPDLLLTYYHSSSISTTLCRENTSTTSRRQEMLSKSP